MGYDNRSRRSRKKANPFYESKEWRRLVRRIKTGRCSRCGCSDKRTVIDHIKELKDGGAALAGHNLQELCTGCHSTKTRQAAELRGQLRSMAGGRDENSGSGDVTARGRRITIPGNPMKQGVSERSEEKVKKIANMSPEMAEILNRKFNR